MDALKKYKSLMNRVQKSFILVFLIFFLSAGGSWADPNWEQRAEFRLQLLENRQDLIGKFVANAIVKYQASRKAVVFRVPEEPSPFAPLHNNLNLTLNRGWRKIGGQGVNNSWHGGNKTKALAVHQGKLYAGLQSRHNAQVWSYNGKVWQRIKQWTGLSYVVVLCSYKNALYAGIDNELWKFSKGEWKFLSRFGNKSTLVYLGFELSKLTKRRDASPVGTFHSFPKISVCLRFRG